MLTAVVGINWGDEGKGRMVDLLSSDYGCVVRYQGGNNAGHTVINERGTFIMNLLPSGILRPGTINVLGVGMVIDFEHLFNELEALRAKGIEITPENLKISDRATICMPYHKLLDELEEDRLAGRKFGSTRRGIAPVYADKYMKRTLRAGDLRSMDYVKTHLSDILEWKNLLISGGYSKPDIKLDELLLWVEKYCLPFLPYITDTSDVISDAAARGISVLFEAQLGALRDIDYGIYPFTSSSSAIAAYAPIGSGVPFMKLDRVIGIMKAYSTCVGEGPFVCEFFGDEAETLRRAGGEYGAATGRPRRVGGFDVLASRYGVRVQGADELALTKLDVLSGMEKIPVCTGYTLDGKRLKSFPSGDELLRAQPVYEYFPGFDGDISSCRRFSDLPSAARSYVKLLEDAVDCRISYISVGADREQFIKM